MLIRDRADTASSMSGGLRPLPLRPMAVGKRSFLVFWLCSAALVPAHACDAWCTGNYCWGDCPPFSPSPPNPPAPPAAPPPLPPPARPCAADFTSCLDMFCCESPDFACFKRDGKQFAICRRVHAASCESEPNWLCPDEWLVGRGVLPLPPPSPAIPPYPARPLSPSSPPRLPVSPPPPEEPIVLPPAPNLPPAPSKPAPSPSSPPPQQSPLSPPPVPLPPPSLGTVASELAAIVALAGSIGLILFATACLCRQLTGGPDEPLLRRTELETLPMDGETPRVKSAKHVAKGPGRSKRQGYGRPAESS